MAIVAASYAPGYHCSQLIPTEADYVTRYEVSGSEWLHWMRTKFSYSVYFTGTTKLIGFIKDAELHREELPAIKIVKSIFMKSFRLMPIEDIFLSNPYPSPWKVEHASDINFNLFGINVFAVNANVIANMQELDQELITPTYVSMFGINSFCNNSITLNSSAAEYHLLRETFKSKPCQNFTRLRDEQKVSFELQVESQIFKDNMALKYRQVTARYLAQNSLLKTLDLSVTFHSMAPYQEVKKKLYSELVQPFDEGLLKLTKMLPFKDGHDLKYRINLRSNINEDKTEQSCELFLTLRNVGDPYHVFARMTRGKLCNWSKVQKFERILELMDTISLFGLYAAGIPIYRPLEIHNNGYDFLCLSDHCGFPNSFFVEALSMLSLQFMTNNKTVPNSEIEVDGCKIYRRYNNSTLTSISTKNCNCSDGYELKEVTEQKLNPDTYTFASKTTSVTLNFGGVVDESKLSKEEMECRNGILMQLVSNRDDQYMALAPDGKLFGQVEVVLDRLVSRSVNDNNKVFDFYGAPVNENTLIKAQTITGGSLDKSE